VAETSRDREPIDVTAHVRIGPQYSVGRIQFTGHGTINDSTLRRAFTLRERSCSTSASYDKASNDSTTSGWQRQSPLRDLVFTRHDRWRNRGYHGSTAQTGLALVVGVGPGHSRAGVVPSVDLFSSAGMGPRSLRRLNVSRDIQCARTRQIVAWDLERLVEGRRPRWCCSSARMCQARDRSRGSPGHRRSLFAKRSRSTGARISDPVHTRSSMMSRETRLQCPSSVRDIRQGRSSSARQHSRDGGGSDVVPFGPSTSHSRQRCPNAQISDNSVNCPVLSPSVSAGTPSRLSSVSCRFVSGVS
jgi:hypothetical protein